MKLIELASRVSCMTCDSSYKRLRCRHRRRVVLVSAPENRLPRSWNRTKSRPPSSRSKSAPPRCGGIFDYDAKRERLEEVNRELENPAVWSDSERAQNLGRERAELEGVVATLNRVEKSLDEAGELHELAAEEQDASTLGDVVIQVEKVT